MVTKAPPAPMVLDYNWTGFYLGGFVGYLSGRLEGPPLHVTDARNLEDDGWTAGLLAGYRYQFPNRFVLGLQLTVPLWAEKGTATSFGFPGTTYEVETNYAILGNVQLGYAFGRWLPFVQGGVGFANVTSRVFNFVPAVLEVEQDHTLWTVGAGLDYAVTNNFIVGARYTYVDVVRENHTNLQNAAFPPTDFGLTGHGVGFTLAYRFCGPLGGAC
jgi:opacity protein-like surface antigen